MDRDENNTLVAAIEETTRTAGSIQSGLRIWLNSLPPTSSLDLTCSLLYREDLDLLGVFISRTRHLRHLRLDHNGLSDVGMQTIAHFIAGNTTLTEISLGENMISDIGANALADALRSQTGIGRVLLPHNELTSEGVKSICNALSIRHHTRSVNGKLDFSHNENVGSEGAKAVAVLLSRSQFLSHVNLRGCLIGDDGASWLSESLSQTHSLSVLDISMCVISGSSGLSLAQHLEENLSLEKLSLRLNEEMDDFGIRSICASVMKKARKEKFILDVFGCGVFVEIDSKEVVCGDYDVWSTDGTDKTVAEPVLLPETFVMFQDKEQQTVSVEEEKSQYIEVEKECIREQKDRLKLEKLYTLSQQDLRDSRRELNIMKKKRVKNVDKDRLGRSSLRDTSRFLQDEKSEVEYLRKRVAALEGSCSETEVARASRVLARSGCGEYVVPLSPSFVSRELKEQVRCAALEEVGTMMESSEEKNEWVRSVENDRVEEAERRRLSDIELEYVTSREVEKWKCLFREERQKRISDEKIRIQWEESLVKRGKDLDVSTVAVMKYRSQIGALLDALEEKSKVQTREIERLKGELSDLKNDRKTDTDQ